MQNPSVEPRVVDNSVILFSLLLARYLLRTNTSYPPRIKQRLMKRLQILIDEYRDPDKGISFDDEEEANAPEAQCPICGRTEDHVH